MNPDLLKQLRQIFYCLAVLAVFAGLCGFFFNLKTLIHLDEPQDAAIHVLAKYQPQQARDATAVVLVTVGNVVQLRLKNGNSDVANVTIKNYLGFGWQECFYERLND